MPDPKRTAFAPFDSEKCLKGFCGSRRSGGGDERRGELEQRRRLDGAGLEGDGAPICHIFPGQLDGEGLGLDDKNQLVARTAEGEFKGFTFVEACTPFKTDEEAMLWGAERAVNPMLAWSDIHPRNCFDHQLERELSKHDGSRRSEVLTFIAVKRGHPDYDTAKNPFTNMACVGGQTTAVSLRGWRILCPGERIANTSVPELLVVEMSRDGTQMQVRADTGTWP